MGRHSFPLEFDLRHPDFRDQYRLWAFAIQCEIVELVAITKETITTSRALLKQVDQMLSPK